MVALANLTKTEWVKEQDNLKALFEDTLKTLDFFIDEYNYLRERLDAFQTERDLYERAVYKERGLIMNRVPKIHELKILPQYFNEVVSGNKQFELRKDNRDYQIGDLLLLKEYLADKDEYTGRESNLYKITYILRNVPEYGLMDGYCIIGW